MPIRRRLGDWILAPALEGMLRDHVDAALADRAGQDGDDRVVDLEARIAKLEKKLDMAMGAIQASSAQVMQLKAALEEANGVAAQARQQAQSALATAESAADGIGALEDAVAELGKSKDPAPKKAPTKKKAAPKKD